MKGSLIADDVVVAAGAMVTGEIPSSTICAGVSASVIKEDIIWCDERIDTIPERLLDKLSS